MKFKHTELIWDLYRLVWEPSLSLPEPLRKVTREIVVLGQFTLV